MAILIAYMNGMVIAIVVPVQTRITLTNVIAVAVAFISQRHTIVVTMIGALKRCVKSAGKGAVE